MIGVSSKNQAGVSYVELLVVITILVTISTIALVNIGSSKKQLGRQNVARELKSAFERARFDSVKRRADSGNQAKVIVSANSFKLRVDVNRDGTVDTTDEVVNDAWMADVSICDSNGDPLSTDTTVIFDRRGEITTTGGDAVFLVCNGDCSEEPSSSNANLILINKTGTVNLLSGGTSIPSFTAPNVNAISVNTGIVNSVRVN